MKLTFKETRAWQALYQPTEGAKPMSTTTDKIMEAANALALSQSLLEEAAHHAPEAITRRLQGVIAGQQADRHALIQMMHTAALDQESRRGEEKEQQRKGEKA
jgi:hypothetical protein